MDVQHATKKPVTIEFMRWDGGAQQATPIITWILSGDGTARYVDYDPVDRRELIEIATLEGTMRADPGDCIIRGVKGEHYPCKPGIFAETYDVLPAASCGATATEGDQTDG